MDRKPLIVGNWKMFGDQASIAELLSSLRKVLADKTEVGLVVCPPAIYLKQCADALAGSNIAWGGQDLCAYVVDNGAYTGELSAQMLADIGCSYVIIGHSERREYQQESNELVAQKFVQAQAKNLQPILCVGESLAQREAGETLNIIAQQLDAVLVGNGVDVFQNACIAYEPIWAIGTGLSATPEQAQDVHAFIRKKISASSTEIAEQVQILYGGSVKPTNAATLFAEPDIDGALVGGASLVAQDFAAISQSVEV